MLITGATGGLGRECARVIVESKAGWHVIACGRDDARLESLGQQLRGSTGHGTVEALRLDLESLKSVHEAADKLAAGGRPPLRAIVCNAAVQVLTPTYTPNGYEATFAVNHLAHFLLVNLLLDKLVAPARVVFVSSGVHDPAGRTGMPAPAMRPVRELASGQSGRAEPEARAGRRRYATSKLCNVLCAYELHRRLERQGRHGISVNAFDPGLMPGTGLARHYSGLQRLLWRFVFPLLRPLPGVSSMRASGRMLARLAVDPDLDGVSAQYFSGNRKVRSSEESYDETTAAELWAGSVELVGLAKG